MKKKLISVILIITILGSYTLCLGAASPKPNITKVPLKSSEFSIKVLKNNFNGQSITISPISIISALSMLDNGSRGTTQKEIEKSIGLSTKDLNDFFKHYYQKPSKNLLIANSIWINKKNGIKLKKNFKNLIYQNYNGIIRNNKFDNKGVLEINRWIEKKTQNMIKDMLDSSTSSEIEMALINALSFKDAWLEPYDKSTLEDGQFIREDGLKENVKYMLSTEYNYIKGHNFIGFAKPYKNQNYEFVALLPSKSLNMKNFLNKLNSKDLLNALSHRKNIPVETKLPSFSSKWSNSLNASLKNMGIKKIFSSVANLNGISNYQGLYVSDILHQTKINVTPKGTKAGAATVIMMNRSLPPQKIKTVNLERPFVYMIIDKNFNLPIFYGIYMGK